MHTARNYRLLLLLFPRGLTDEDVKQLPNQSLSLSLSRPLNGPHSIPPVIGRRRRCVLNPETTSLSAGAFFPRSPREISLSLSLPGGILFLAVRAVPRSSEPPRWLDLVDEGGNKILDVCIYVYVVFEIVRAKCRLFGGLLWGNWE